MTDFNMPMYYINRELSWVAFNERVLEEAVDPDNPLFEQLKFISIACSNLDEFFMVRVAGLKEQIKSGFLNPDNKTQMSPQAQINAISACTHNLVRRIYEILSAKIIPDLKREGIQFLQANELNEEQEAFIEEYYHNQIYPVLTPLGVDASRPFPMISNKSLNLAVLLESRQLVQQDPKQLFAVVQVPSVLPRYVQLPSANGNMQFILLENIICKYMHTLFQGNTILYVSPFRITRNLDLIFEIEEEEDLLEAIQKELKRRRKGDAVRIEVARSMPEVLKDTLKDWLELEDEDIYPVDGPIDLTFFMGFISCKKYEHLKYIELKPKPPGDLIGEIDIFEAIAKKDILLHHPYELFEPVIHFVRLAAEDPNVLAIKQTLYRVGGNSPIVNALMRAAENGKQVTVLVELKARFDEEKNIEWAKKLEEAGCHVIYGVDGLKTHSKITLVVRLEQGVIKRYVHLGTGNYNETTARIYTDLGLFSAQEELGIDASAFFNHLSGFSVVPKWKQITTAPKGLREKFIALIENEIKQTTEERPGRMIAKMNSLTDKEIIKVLYKASCAGVKIDLIVRGICCLRPGIPGVSENIQVRSIIGRFLEHSRIYYFQNGGNEKLFLSSADWMTRNMVGRVEILFPVIQDNLKARLKNILHTMLLDNVKARLLQADGSYIRKQDAEGIQIESQMYFYQEIEQNHKKQNIFIH